MVRERVADGRGAWLPPLLAIAFSLVPAASTSQPVVSTSIVRDGSIGPNEDVQPEKVADGLGFEYQIIEDLGERRGTNLFHSFSEFDISSSDGVHFSVESDQTTNNVISRVTSGFPSQIDGKIRSSIDGADVYLLNPSGILFGERARLDVKGAFRASTAESLAFSGGSEAVFVTGEVRPLPLVDFGDPAAFGFLGGPEAKVSLDGSILLNRNGGISFHAGSVELLNGAALVTQASEADAGGDIELVALHDIMLSGEKFGIVPARVSATTSTDRAGGSIWFEAPSVRLQDGADVITTAAGNERSGAAGEIVVRAATELTLSGRVPNSLPEVQGASIQSTSPPTGGGAAGTIEIHSPRVELKDGAGIFTETQGAGHGGNIAFRSDGDLVLAGTLTPGVVPPTVIATSRGEGRGGAVDVTAGADGSVTIDQVVLGTEVSGSGIGGDVTIGAPADVAIIGTRESSVSVGLLASTLGPGDAGDLSIRSNRIRLENGAAIFSNTLGPKGTEPGFDGGDAGEISLIADSSISISGLSAQGLGSAVSSSSGTAGKAGDVVLRAPSIEIKDQANILSEAVGDGPAGLLSIRAEGAAGRGHVVIAGSRVSNSSLGEGATQRLEIVGLAVDLDHAQIENITLGSAGGTEIDIEGSERVTVTSSSVAADSFVGDGDAGAVTIKAPVIRIVEGSAVTAQSAGVGGSAGRIELVATDSITLSEGGALFGATVGAFSGFSQQQGDPGSILIHAPDVRIENGASVNTNTNGARQGGEITIIADERLTLTGTSQLNPQFRSSITSDASGQSGDAGSIRIETPIFEMEDRSQVRSLTIAEGDGGEIRLDVGELHMRGGVSITATSRRSGDAGSIVIGSEDGKHRTTRVTLSEGSSITTSSTVEPPFPTELDGGSAGSVILNVAGDVELTDSSIESVARERTGDAGSLVIRARNLRLVDSRITTESDRAGAAGSIDLAVEGQLAMLRSEVDTTTSSTFDPEGVARGRIDIAADRVSLVDSDVRASTSGRVDAGSIALRAEDIVLTHGSAIRSASTGSGEAGSIGIEPQAARIRLAESEISTSAVDSGGGNVEIAVRDFLILERGSALTASVAGGAGGNIKIGSPEFVLLREASSIIARAAQEGGSGGQIEITADAFVKSPDSVIDASAPGGPDVQGTVVINAPTGVVEAGITPLSTAFLEASALLRPSCAARGSAGREGSFLVARRRGLPTSPEELLLAFEDLGTSTLEIAEERDELPPVAGEPPELEGLQIAQVSLAQGATAFRGGRFERAEQYWSQAAVPSGNASVRGDALRGLGQAQQARGQYADSVASLQAALVLAEESGDATRIAASLGSLANTYVALRQFEAADVLFARGVGLSKESGKPGLGATLLNNLGNAYATRQSFDEALAAYEESATLASEAGRRELEVQALANAARAAIDAKKIERASQLLNHTWGRGRPLVPSHATASVLIHAARSYARVAAASPELREPALLNADGALRRAVQVSQEIGDRRSLGYALGNLGALYQREHRLDEALYLTRRALRLAQAEQAPELLYRWHWQEGQILWAQGRAPEAARAYRRAVEILDETRHETLARYGSAEVYFRRMVAPVYLDLVDALLQGAAMLEERDPERAQRLLVESRDTMEQLKAAELRDYFRDECVADLEAKAIPLEAVSPHTAVVYPIVLPGRLELLVSLPSGLQRYAVAASARQVNQTVHRFRGQVQSRTGRTYLAAGQTLYQWLVAPYADELAQQKIDTLVFVPSGSLRTIPMAALHDGSRHLVETYALPVTPSLTLLAPERLDLSQAKLLLAGVSESVQGFPSLPQVPGELRAVQVLYGGDLLLNEDFALARLEEKMVEAQPSVVHIASHAVFTGDPATSFLLTYDGRLTMDRLGAVVGQGRFRDDPLELLILSACETAAGDERAALGLAGVAIRAGARSAIGSLWAIADESTSELVVEFYRQLKDPRVTKAEALRRAQQSLLASPEFAHPFYWSPFLLIGNWL